MKSHFFVTWKGAIPSVKHSAECNKSHTRCPRCLYIPHNTVERHFSPVTFKNIWSEEVLIVYCCFSYSLHFLSLFLFHPWSCPPLLPFLSKQHAHTHTHTNTHAWALIWLVQSVQGQERALMEKFVQLISGGLEMQDPLSFLSLTLFLPQPLTFSLSFSLFWFLVSFGWICIFWIRVKARRKRKREDIAALSLQLQDLNCGVCAKKGKKTISSLEEVSSLSWQ